MEKEKTLEEQILENDELLKMRDFANEIKKRVSENINENQKVSIELVNKNNGVTYLGLVIKEKDSNLAPTIHLNGYYDKYIYGTTIDDIVEDIWMQYNENIPTEEFDIKSFMDFEKIKDRIIMKLVNTELNKKLLEDIPSRPFADMSLVYIVFVDKSHDGFRTITINKQHMKIWKVAEEELYNQALVNTPKIFKSRLDSMYSIFNQLTGHTLNGFDGVNMHVLTNNVKVEGATCIAYPELLKGIHDIFKEDFYIIPSSIHDVLVMPKKTFEEVYSWGYLKDQYVDEILDDVPNRKYKNIEDIPEEADVDLEEYSINVINKMIHLTNTDCLRDEDVLGNHVYICDGEKLIWFDEETGERKEFGLN